MTRDQKAAVAFLVGVCAVICGIALVSHEPMPITADAPSSVPAAAVTPTQPPEHLPNACGRFGIEVTYLDHVPSSPATEPSVVNRVTPDTPAFPGDHDSKLNQRRVNADAMIAWQEDHDARRVDLRLWVEGDASWTDLPPVDLPRWEGPEEQTWYNAQVNVSVDHPSKPVRIGLNNGVRNVRVLELERETRRWREVSNPEAGTRLGSEYAVGPWEPNECLFPCFGLEDDLVRWGVDPRDQNEEVNYDTFGVQHAPCLSVRRSPEDEWTRVKTEVPLVGRICQRLDDNRILASGGIDGYVVFPKFSHRVDIIELDTLTVRNVIPDGRASRMIAHDGPEVIWLGLDGMTIFHPDTEAVQTCEPPDLRFEPELLQAASDAQSVVVSRNTIPPSAARLTVVFGDRE